MASSTKLILAFGAVGAFAAAPAAAQQLGVVGGETTQVVQAAPGDVAAVDDAQLLSEVLAALPPGVTLETATDDQIAAAVSTVVAARGAAAGTAGSQAQTDAIANVAAQTLSVVSVTLDSIGRSGSANAVTTQVTNTLPPQARGQVQQQVASSRANPTPSQVGATAIVISQVQPAAGQQQQQVLPIVPQNTNQNLGQTVFQENPNQVSPS